MARLTTYKEVRIEIRFAIYLAKKYMCFKSFQRNQNRMGEYMSRLTIKDLKSAVKDFNETYCKDSDMHLVIDKACGGYEVCLTNKNRKNGISHVSITHGHDSARNTIVSLYNNERYLPEIIRLEIERSNFI